MMIYIIIYSISLILINIYNKNKASNKLFIFLALLLLSGLAGLRNYNIGTDTNLYVVPFFKDCINYYKGGIIEFYKFNEWTYDFEILYAYLNYIVSSISNNANFYLFISHLLMLGVVFHAIDKTKVNITFAAFMFLTVFMRETLNAARQSLALSFCILAISILITKGKFKWVLLSLIAAYGFHHSALVFISIILLYKLIQMKTELLNSNITKFITVVIILLTLFSFNQILVYLSGLGIGEEKYIERYGSSDQYGSNVPISVIALTLFNVTIFYLCKKRIRILKDKVFTVFSEYILIISVFLCGLALISTFAIRINTYFIYLSILIIPYYIYKNRSRFLFYLTICFYIFYWIMTVCIANLGNTYPYESKILGIW